MTAEVEITNTGQVAGKEVVQLYLSAPCKSASKPVKELKAFVKTPLLEPGESQVVNLTLDPMSLCSFDAVSSSWLAEAGAYEVRVGASSRDIRQHASFTLTDPGNVEEVSRSLVPQHEINVITPNP
jgi:beta-glucosidase